MRLTSENPCTTSTCTGRPMHVARLIFGAWVCIYTLAAQEPASCAQYASFRLVSRSSLAKALVERVEPKDPLIDNGVVHAKVTVHVFVDTEGKVTCARPVGTPNRLLARISVEAAQKCRFRSRQSGGKKIAIQGDMVFQIDR